MFAALLGAAKHKSRGVVEEKGWYCGGWALGVSVNLRVDSRPGGRSAERTLSV